MTASAKALAGDDPAGAPGPSPDRVQADALFHQGVAAIHAADWERARRLFEASYALLPRGTTLGNEGAAEVELGQLVEGLHHLKQALAMIVGEDAKKAVAQRAFEEAYAKTGHLTLRTTSGASVSVDGIAQPGTAPFVEPIDVLPGKRVVEARLDRQTVEREVEAPAGSVVEVEIPLREPVVTSPSASLARPDRSVIDPGVQRDAEPGGRAGSWWSGPRIVGASAGAGALVALGVGIYFHESAVNEAGDINGLRGQIAPNECPPSASSAVCSNLRSKWNGLQESDTAAKVSWAIAGVAAAGAVVAFVVGAQGSSRPAAGFVVRPLVGPGAIGLEGNF